MAYYLIAAALAAFATQSSALAIAAGVATEDSEVLGSPFQFYKSCPNPHWAYIKEYHTYPFERNVQWFWKCGHQTVLKKCPENTVFNQEFHYCDREKETSKNFVCPSFWPTSSGYSLFPDPNFEHQYHKCYDYDNYPRERLACPYNQIFDKSTSRCKYACHEEDKEGISPSWLN